MTSYALRSATAADAPRIRNLVRTAHLNPTGLDWERFTVAETPSGGVIGCVQIKPHRDGSDELASLVVASDYQGQGIARALAEQITGLYEGTLYLMCRATLGGFYEKFGFRGIHNPEALPTYFRRISKLASLAEVLSKDGDSLLIMMRSS